VVLSALALSLITSVHALLTKRDAASAVAWIGVVWLSPFVGAGLYFTLGINRVQRKAVRLLGKAPPLRPAPSLPPAADLPEAWKALPVLARAVGRITGQPLLDGNRFEPLRNGDEAYPPMLDAIRGAGRSVAFLTYILDGDGLGAQFVDALIAAHRRGVQVRVLIDGIGARRSWAPVRRLRDAGVPTEVFLWSWAPWKMALVNLRNHRKLLVVDGTIAFTGGMNIDEDFVHEDGPGLGRDLHFGVHGPVVRALVEQFAVDWAFSAEETLEGEAWYPPVLHAGPTYARVIPDGPDEDRLKVSAVLFQALTLARERVLVVTPYFLPPNELHAAMIAAVLRGVDVRVVLPADNDPWWMNRPTLADVEGLVERGVKVGFASGPFEHAKLTVVDDAWVLLGSSNWDLRSLRLNFELVVECYDPLLARACLDRLDDSLSDVKWLSTKDLDDRNFLQKLGDRAIRLFKPWL
jgi:cardiolipin synthase